MACAEETSFVAEGALVAAVGAGEDVGADVVRRVVTGALVDGALVVSGTAVSSTVGRMIGVSLATGSAVGVGAVSSGTATVVAGSTSCASAEPGERTVAAAIAAALVRIMLMVFIMEAATTS